jgi:hypothetical protein
MRPSGCGSPEGPTCGLTVPFVKNLVGDDLNTRPREPKADNGSKSERLVFKHAGISGLNQKACWIRRSDDGDGTPRDAE